MAVLGPYMSKETFIEYWCLLKINGVIVGLVTYESDLGEAYFCLDERYNDLKSQTD